MRLLAGVAVLAAALLLGGCSTAPQPEPVETAMPDLIDTTVPRDSTPGFLSDHQADVDLITDENAIDGVNPDSTRYQGTWHGSELYLGVAGENAVRLISHTPGDPSSWGVGGTTGNSVISIAWTEDDVLQYVPQGTSDLPEGWSAFSDWLAVRD